MARQKRVLFPSKTSTASKPSKVSEAEWVDTVDALKVLADLDREDFRKKGKKLIRALEREGLEAHRNADRLEKLSVFSDVKTPFVRPSEHSRSATVSRLESESARESARGFTARHLHLVRFQIDRLAETALDKPGELRQQAALVLDAAEYLNDALKGHARNLAELYSRRGPRGPRPSVMMERIVDMMVHWEMTPTDTFKLLSAEGILVISVASLAMRLSRRRELDPDRNEMP